MSRLSVKHFFKTTPDEGYYVANRDILNYAIGLTGQNMTYSYVSGWLRYFCINILHIAPDKVGALFSFTYIWDAINDPVVGAVIDRRKHKPYNKLRPYLLYMPPIIGVLSMLMFLNTPFDEQGRSIYIFLVYLVWDFFYSFQDVGLWGMIAVSTSRSDERSKIAQWVSIGAGAGGAIAGVFQQVRGMLNGAGISDIYVFMIFGIIFGLGGELLSIRAHKIKEVIDDNSPKESVIKSLTVLRHNPTLLLISLARFSLALGPKVQNAYFFENAITFEDGKHLEFLFGLLAGIPGAGAVFFANIIAKKVGGMKKVLILSQIMAISLRLITFFVGYDSWPKFFIMCLLISLVNIPGSLMDIAHRTLTSNSIDEVELKTGIRTEGVSFSMQNFTTKMQNAASTFIEGKLLSYLKYDSHASQAGLKQNAKFIKWQWPMFMLGPVVGAILYLIAISFIKDSKEHREEVEKQLRERKEEINKLSNKDLQTEA